MQYQPIKICWIRTKEIVTDGLTKALPVIKHEQFVRMTGIGDKKELLAYIKQEDDLGDAFQQRGADISELFGFGITMS